MVVVAEDRAVWKHDAVPEAACGHPDEAVQLSAALPCAIVEAGLQDVRGDEKGTWHSVRQGLVCGECSAVRTRLVVCEHQDVQGCLPWCVACAEVPRMPTAHERWQCPRCVGAELAKVEEGLVTPARSSGGAGVATPFGPRPEGQGPLPPLERGVMEQAERQMEREVRDDRHAGAPRVDGADRGRCRGRSERGGRDAPREERTVADGVDKSQRDRQHAE